MKAKSKRGNISVFLAVVITALFSITILLVSSIHEKTVESCADGVFRLAGDSVLSEYNYYIHRDYGLFLIKGDDPALSKKFRDYSAYSLSQLFGADFHSCTVETGRFSIADPEPVLKQAVDLMKEGGIIRNGKSSVNDMVSRTLRHGPTIDSLPSAQLPDKDLTASVNQIADKLTNPEAIIRGGTDKYLFDSYILSRFNSDTCAIDTSHFYRNEVEYILTGRLSDESNVSHVDLSLEALRTPYNLAHIYADPEKRAAVTALSETITPGVLGTVTQAGISLAWATAESVNDVKLLHKGYLVPFTKDASSWAIDLDGLVKGISDEKVFKPDVNKGQSYDDYLRILLFLKDDNMKMARVLDLIQINMRKDHDPAFLIQEYATGIAVTAEVNGKKYFYDKTY